VENKILFALAIVGLAGALVSAYIPRSKISLEILRVIYEFMGITCDPGQE
jgi:hypothetical protein